MKRALKYAAIGLAVVLTLVVLAAGGKVAQIHVKRSREVEAHAISEIREYTLGGIPQKVMLDGADTDAPLVLFLHGGPGTPMPYNVGSRGLVPEISTNSILVTWDQYASGINNADQPVSVDEYRTMTVDLIRALKRDFPDNRLTVFGVSWGSLLATHAATAVPELIDEVVAYGQITRELYTNDVLMEALRAANLREKERARLEGIAKQETLAPHDVEFLSGLIQRRTEGLLAKGTSMLDFLDLIVGAATSPDYSFQDFGALFRNGTTGNPQLLDEMLAQDLRGQLAEVTIPYFVVQGDKDLVTTTAIVRRDIGAMDNPNLHYVELPNTSHIPSQEALEYLLDSSNGLCDKKCVCLSDVWAG